MGSFRNNLEEMDQTITRLRDQLRRLEKESDDEGLSAKAAQGGNGAQALDTTQTAERSARLQQLSRGLLESVSDLQSIRDILDGIVKLPPRLSVSFRLIQDWFDQGGEGALVDRLPAAGTW